MNYIVPTKSYNISKDAYDSLIQPKKPSWADFGNKALDKAYSVTTKVTQLAIAGLATVLVSRLGFEYFFSPDADNLSFSTNLSSLYQDKLVTSCDAFVQTIQTAFLNTVVAKEGAYQIYNGALRAFIGFRNFEAFRCEYAANQDKLSFYEKMSMLVMTLKAPEKDNTLLFTDFLKQDLINGLGSKNIFKFFENLVNQTSLSSYPKYCKHGFGIEAKQQCYLTKEPALFPDLIALFFHNFSDKEKDLLLKQIIINTKGHRSTFHIELFKSALTSLKLKGIDFDLDNTLRVAIKKKCSNYYFSSNDFLEFLAEYGVNPREVLLDEARKFPEKKLGLLIILNYCPWNLSIEEKEQLFQDISISYWKQKKFSEEDYQSKSQSNLLSKKEARKILNITDESLSIQAIKKLCRKTLAKLHPDLLKASFNSDDFYQVSVACESLTSS